MSDVGPSKAAVNATVRFADVPRESTPDSEAAQFFKALLTETPTRRTPVHRWKAGKRKVIALIGSLSCLLWGFVDTTVLHLVHIVPRTLWRTHPELFILLQEAVGKVVVTDGVEERVLFLDCTGNSDIMNCISHNLFDGLSVDKGLGGGNFFLLPVNLDECLAIMRNAKGKKIDYIQMFPGRKFEYYVYHIGGCQAMQMPCWGPLQRTYAHLDDLLPEEIERLAGGDLDDPSHSGDDGDVQDDDDEDDEDDETGVADAKAHVITPDDVPEEYRKRPEFGEDYIPHESWLPRDAPRIVVSHTNPVFHLWNGTYKLRTRITDTENYDPLSLVDEKLYHKLWNSLSHLYDTTTPEARAIIEEVKHRRIFQGATRRSRRLATMKKNQTEPTPKAKPLDPSKPRNAHSEPGLHSATASASATSSSSTPLPAAAPSSRYELRSRTLSNATSAAAPPSRYELRSRTKSDATPVAAKTPTKRAATDGADKGRKTKKRKTG
ncbi:hypothetical protein GGG16DRAFT_63493 [Schizophyllum commune]